MSHTWTWNTDQTPDFQNMTTIGVPAASTVRNLADDARDLGVDDTRVAVDFQGFIPESHAATILDQLLFDVWPPFSLTCDAESDVQFSARETIHVENEGDVCVRVFVSADDGDVTDVELTAYPA